ncbi:SDR family NAD(P)-dependent oxidoreductase [Pontibacter silvestris]|uniref:SDR family NAD(P)-dependent oxidoreductase n=1 Tax=Pontibacter silvestris TaxID=2305183 RepID=A0ABW4X2Z8_9BACT|nr:SDR family oxidoreductase [Pontibacter silvestris]MCC9137140.1 SDR family oxidoreductase [Pontibacter silvestris]
MADKTTPKGTALITGASSGIGLELADIFAQHGYNLVLVARSGEKLEQLAFRFAVKHKVYSKVIAQDLAEHDAPQKIFNELKQAGIVVAILVNNAGFGNYGHFRETALQAELDMMQVNMVALTYLCKLFLWQLPEGQGGKILNVSSVAAFPPGPLMAIYYASKAYVLSFSEALTAELGDIGVTVTALCPGPTATNFKDRANLEGSRLFSKLFSTDARKVAKAGFEGLMKGKPVVLVGLRSKLTPHMVYLVPRPLLLKVIKFIQEKRQ